jgi:hypothetical protein
MSLNDGVIEVRWTLLALKMHRKKTVIHKWHMVKQRMNMPPYVSVCGYTLDSAEPISVANRPDIDYGDICLSCQKHYHAPGSRYLLAAL